MLIPLVLLACDYYISDKLNKKLLLDKIPFFIISVVFGYFMFEGQLISNDFSQIYSYLDRVFLSSYAVIFYIYKFIFPINLLAIYGHPALDHGLLPIKYYISTVIIFLAAFLIFRMKKYRKEVAFGFLFYLFAILYFTQLFPVEGAIVSERYAYIPYAGLLFIVAFFIQKIQENEIQISMKLKRGITIGLSVYLLFFATSSWNRNKVWVDDITLFTDVLKKNPTMAGAYWSRANAKSTIGDHKGAIDDYSMALNIEPNIFKAYFNRAVQKTLIEDYNGAISDYTEALKLAPGEHDIFYNRGSIKLILENDSGAIEDFTEALYLSPDFAESYYYRGVAKYNLADDNGSISDYNEAIRIKPNYAEAYYNRGNAKYNLKDNQGAINDYTEAIKYNPNYAEAYFNRAIQKIILQDTLDAIKDYTYAIQANPQYANAYGARGLLNLRYDKQAAYKDFQKARELGVNASFEMLEEHFNKK
jgi:tetratricopeptide (TPR) repeat protein